ncbi:MAG: metal ABC transporter permease [Erysipelotrichaceae bacterium]
MNVTELLVEALQSGFMLRAMGVGVLIAISSAILGVFLVLRKYAMIGDGLAHVSFATVALALVLNQSPILLSIPLVSLASIFILRLSQSAKLHGDAAIGVVSSTSLAIGIVLSSVAQGFNVDLFSYLFGSILVIREIEVILSIVLSILVIGLVAYYYHDLFAIAYDEEFAQLVNISVDRMNVLIAVLSAITIVLGIRVLGTMLISSLIIFPCISAMQLGKGFRFTIVFAAFVAAISVVSGVLLSFVLDLPTGATIVVMQAILFGLLYLYRKVVRA